MNIFQIIVTILILSVLFFISKYRGVLFRRAFYILLTLIGLILLFFPNLTQKIADILGIGRGTDLLTYAFILFSWFWFISTSVKIQNLEQTITRIVRDSAINNVINAGNNKSQQSH